MPELDLYFKEFQSNYVIWQTGTKLSEAPSAFNIREDPNQPVYTTSHPRQHILKFSTMRIITRIFSLFNNTFSSSDYIALNDRVINELERM